MLNNNVFFKWPIKIREFKYKSNNRDTSHTQLRSNLLLYLNYTLSHRHPVSNGTVDNKICLFLNNFIIHLILNEIPNFTTIIHLQKVLDFSDKNCLLFFTLLDSENYTTTNREIVKTSSRVLLQDVSLRNFYCHNYHLCHVRSSFASTTRQY